jgi:hypothetical protein
VSFHVFRDLQSKTAWPVQQNSKQVSDVEGVKNSTGEIQKVV